MIQLQVLFFLNASCAPRAIPLLQLLAPLAPFDNVLGGYYVVDDDDGSVSSTSLESGFGDGSPHVHGWDRMAEEGYVN